jgi:hypothetical protein
MSDVATPTAEHAHLCELWKLPRTLMGGTRAMRNAADLYLPQEPGETLDAYKVRLKRSTLFNAFGKTVKDMSGKVFRKPVVLGDDVPEKLKGYAEDIDLAGTHLNVFAFQAFTDVLQVGIGYILTDMPPKLERGSGRNGEVTAADIQSAGLRPYLCFIKAENLIGWKAEAINGVMTLTQVRIREIENEPDGEYHEKPVEQIRVLYPGRFEIWRKSLDSKEKSVWTLYASGNTGLQKITLAPIYFNRTGFMKGEPVLQDLADLNVMHWQSSSDQRHILHVARVPILFAAGIQETDQIEIGPNRMVRVSDPAAKLNYIEHGGAAIESGQTDIDKIEQQMQAQGMQLLVAQSGKTATGEIHDDVKENSPLAAMANALGDALEMSFGFMAEYENLGEDKGGSIKVNTDFGITNPNAQGMTDLQAMRNARDLSQQTLWKEAKRRDLLADDFDAETEKGLIESEPPSDAEKEAMELGA